MEKSEWRRTQEDIRFRRALAYKEDPEEMLAREKRRLAILNENNIICPICQGKIHEAVHCPKAKSCICISHCDGCSFFVPATPANNQHCMYK